MDDEATRAAKAERIKALLAGYYGAPGQEGGGQPGPATGAGGAAHLGRPSQHPAMPVTVDSPGFDATSHITNLLRSSTLERLMVEHRSTAREIKNLDTDMQQLVYENYNKFISATDTIRTMKGQVDGALPELEKLKAIMGGFSEGKLSVACSNFACNVASSNGTTASSSKSQGFLYNLSACCRFCC
jgi:hypothetical protein